MAEICTLERRLSKRYNDDNAHLDEWEDTDVKIKQLGTVRTVDDGEGLDDGPTYLSKIVRLTPCDESTFEQLMKQNFQHQGCSCEHDCCGCSSTRITLKRTSAREYKMYVKVSYNY